MPENMTNIAKLLKDAPKGMKLYSPLFGEVKFKYTDDSKFGILVEDSEECCRSFDKYGRYFTTYNNAECLLFPSKDCRTWEGWKLPSKPKFRVGDWLVYKDSGTFCSGLKTIQVEAIEKDRYIFTHATNGTHHFIDSECRLWNINDAQNGDVLVDKYGNVGIYEKMSELWWYSHIYFGCDGHLHGFEADGCHTQKNVKPATSEQRDLLFAKMKEAGYTWDSEKKELKKIPKHYDIANFQLFDKVLVRNSDLGFWRGDIFSSYDDNFYCFRGTWKQCVPYDCNKHLLGTMDPCGEEYINW